MLLAALDAASIRAKGYTSLHHHEHGRLYLSIKASDQPSRAPLDHLLAQGVAGVSVAQLVAGHRVSGVLQEAGGMTIIRPIVITTADATQLLGCSLTAQLNLELTVYSTVRAN